MKLATTMQVSNSSQKQQHFAKNKQLYADLLAAVAWISKRELR